MPITKGPEDCVSLFFFCCCCKDQLSISMRTLDKRRGERASTRSRRRRVCTFAQLSRIEFGLAFKYSNNSGDGRPLGRPKVVKNICRGYLGSILIVPCMAEAAVKPSFYTLVSGPRPLRRKPIGFREKSQSSGGQIMGRIQAK